MRASRERQQRELAIKATQILRAADRREQALTERAPRPKARPLPPAWPDHLRLADLGWVMKYRTANACCPPKRATPTWRKITVLNLRSRQQADVRYWHKADIRLCTANVRFWG
jgi:hypothetical protein